MNDPALYWFIIGVMLGFMGLVLPGFVLLVFGFGAVVTSAVAWFTSVPIAGQLGLFIVSSVLGLLVMDNFIKKRFPGDSGADAAVEDEQEQVVLQAVPGDRGVVSAAIDPPEEGRIKYSGICWRATADEFIEEGEIISVVYQKDLVVHVEKI
ncbi:NfeD family protein [Desulforhopalus singaporensis]|uniref:Membrane protein implicated in regulation of membrane protease activity n=1 Tax=Desulforhopalus singaporensis TaxID=91360 RepID=A0A1H0L322_9BACT|nr:NfeD family protein [Desulforhopalus singaporensis]SDO62619.1 Membrane protein implicated in regulation of membrane protease activity [Desulforhopalus singaporensis]